MRGSSLGAQQIKWVKDPALSLLVTAVVPFDPWPGNCHFHTWPKKKKKKSEGNFMIGYLNKSFLLGGQTGERVVLAGRG